MPSDLFRGSNHGWSARPSFDRLRTKAVCGADDAGPQDHRRGSYKTKGHRDPITWLLAAAGRSMRGVRKSLHCVNKIPGEQGDRYV